MITKNGFETIPYEYHHAPIPGGGFVTGFCFHPGEKDILYARTDIGGVYRYDFERKSWHSLMDHVKTTQIWETFPLSIALDEQHPDWLYIASGDWKNNYLCRSKDRGETFEYFPIPAGVHGNASGRGTGERLAVDPHNPAILYFGSQSEGLLRSEDYGEHWSALPLCQQGGRTELDIAFVWLDPRSARRDRCQTMVIAASGEANSPGGTVRGPSLYLSADGGRTFRVMPGQPENTCYGSYPGFVGQRASAAGKFLFITMASVGYSWNGWKGYACDMGGAQWGCVLRYELSDTGEVMDYSYITPELGNGSGISGEADGVNRSTGFGGICADRNLPGHIICSTQCCSVDETVFYSTDYGEHWTTVLQGLRTGRMDYEGAPYMMPEYNNHNNLIHWLSDIKLDPFDSNRAVFNTGTGIFMTENLLQSREEKSVIWKQCCKGLEETVHLNVYSPPSGEVRLIDILGDLGGFAFTDLTKPAGNSFADEENHRYITCLNADYPDHEPERVVVTARGNWTGHTTGGLILSRDQCRTWQRLPDPKGISNYLDSLVDTIRRPNNNSGWAAISADTRTLVWCVADGQLLPLEAVVYSRDEGRSWKVPRIYDFEGKPVNIELVNTDLKDAGLVNTELENVDLENAGSINAGLVDAGLIDPSLIKSSTGDGQQEDRNSPKAEELCGLTFKVMADRVDPNVFYGFSSDSRMYLSTDGAENFKQIAVPEHFPKLELGGVDNIMPAEIRVESGRRGVVWISTGAGGLWKLCFHTEEGYAGFNRITQEGDSVFRQGMGMAAPSSEYKTIYINGSLSGEYGFYRSMDEGRSWQRINTEQQMYGDIRSIAGDPRTYGRFYIGTGSRGVLWGEPVPIQ